MQVAAIVERRQRHWHIHLPAHGTGRSVSEPHDVLATAVALAAAVTGLSPQEVHIELHLAAPADALLTTPPVDVDVQHTDGAWSTARRIGWARSHGGSWKSVVRYMAHGSTWERTVPAACVRERGSTQPDRAVAPQIPSVVVPRVPPLTAFDRSRSAATRP